MTFIAPHYQKAKKNARFGFFKRDHYLVHTPWWLKKLFPGCLWDMPAKEKTLYLTFDDGPHPTITPFLLDELRKYNAKATFFCIGQNVDQYPKIYQRLIDEGHAVGNHTQTHVNGWKTEDTVYLEDVKAAGRVINSHLFRPPYGRMRKAQMKGLLNGPGKMTIVMWNILAGDWDGSVSPEKCLARVMRRISSNDIIVFHDSEKAWDRMSYAVPRILDHFSAKDYGFEKIV